MLYHRPMSTTGMVTRHSLLDRIFDISLILKGLDGVLELVGGVLLLVVSPKQLTSIVILLTQHELSQDPKDFIATHLLAYVHMLSASVIMFAAAYLLVHGIVKIVLVVAVLKGQLWAYPWLIGFLVIFILYQIYRLILHVSVGLIALTLFDCFIVFLTVLEYRKHLQQRGVTSLKGSVAQRTGKGK
ncbi:MAG TPA: DUF2127 domain-containing protein [Ktedonobacteraceae bacterium]|nr:DUF2127 domain-containing protein [Ktedonobacteraceae bacterium]